ncbi:MAG TPA: cytochrome c peroxidase [Polyangiaceae bacterium]|nr:cytochrome c peroxidase [Polyangiaceae bacterium]
MSRRCTVAVLAILASSCGGTEPAASVEPAPVTHAVVGSSVAVDGSTAYVADADNEALHRVDLRTGEVATTALEAAPEQLVVLDSNRVAVTLRSANAVALVDRGTVRARAQVPTDPWGIAVSPKGELLVTSAWGHALTALDGETLEVRWSIDLGREPRGVVVTPDGSRAFVTHLVGDAITIVDLPTRTARRARMLGGASYRERFERSLGAGTVHPTPALAYAAALSPSGERLFVPHLLEQNGSEGTRVIPGAYGGVPVEEETSVASVAVIDILEERALGAENIDARPVEMRLADKARPIEDVQLLSGAASLASPSVGFAVAVSSAPSRQARAVVSVDDVLLVVSHGTDELIELDAGSLDPGLSVRRSFRVGRGPTGVAVAGNTAVVWAQHSHELNIVDLRAGVVNWMAVGSEALAPELARGRRLFVSEGDRRISRDGRGCASCHPDGRDDGLTWKLGVGPRQTPTLLGRLESGPFGWIGKHAALADNIAETITRLGGTGLSRAELEDLTAYLQRGLPVPRRASALAERGRELFQSAEVGCASCHRLDSQASDRRVHDVGSRARGELHAAFRTPPLLHVGFTPPYFHDGRYGTLEELLSDNLDRMGRTSQLSKDDLAALASFLRTL